MERPQDRRWGAGLEEVSDPEPRDAVEVPPWQPAHGPGPRVTRRTPRPVLEIHVGGVWRLATVMARHDYPDGRTACQVEINLGHSGASSIRTYRWDRRAMRPVATPERPARAHPEASTGGA